MPTKTNPFNKSIADKVADPAQAALDRAKVVMQTQGDKEALSFISVAGESDKSEDEVVTSDDMPMPTAPPEEKYEKEDLLPILDMLLNDGYAIFEFSIRNKPIILRTRFTWEEKAINKFLDKADVKTVLSYQREYAFVTIAASLARFGSSVFEPINAGEQKVLDKSLSDRYDFILSLNSVVTDILQTKLDEFDRKQRYIIKHFDELLKDF